MKLNDIKFLPLDIPYAECDPIEIKKYIDRLGRRTKFTSERLNDPWNHVIVRQPDLEPEPNEIPGSGWKANFKHRFPKVVEAVESMPYKKINMVYILEQFIDVVPHFDRPSREPDIDLEPATYRIALLMEDTNAFYICDDIECTSITHPQFPSESNCWVFSNKKYMHGSNVPEAGLRKILLSVSGELDEQKHFELLEKSYEKYKDYAF